MSAIRGLTGRTGGAFMFGAAPVVIVGAIATPPADWDEMVPFGTAFAKKGYEKIAHKKGVTVWQDTDADTLRVGAEGHIGAPPATILEALIDEEAQQEAIGRLAEAKVLDRGDHWILAYERISPPVIADRDYTIVMTWGEEKGVTWVKYWTAPERGPAPRDGVVRVTNHRGSWQLQPIEGGRAARVRFQVNIDFAGLIPAWLIKIGPAAEVAEVYANVCALVEKQHPGTIKGACPY